MSRASLRLVGLLGVAVLTTTAVASADPKLDGWRSTPGARPEPPGGKAQEDKKKREKKKKEQKPKSETPKDPKAPESPSTPGAPNAPNAPNAPAGPGLPSGLPSGLAGVGLPLGGPSLPEAPVTAPAVTPPPGTPPPVAATAAAAGGAAAGGAAVGGAAAAGGAAVGGAAVGGAGVVPLGAAGAATVAALAAMPLASAGAAVIGPGGSVVLAPDLAKLVALPAHAALTSPAELQALTSKAQQAMAAGDEALSCHLLGQAFAEDRTADRLIKLADCYRAAGLTASAWLAYGTVAAAATDATVRESAVAAATKEQGTLPRLTVTLRPDAASKGGAEKPKVLLDGVPIPDDQVGPAVPFDPGKHVVTVRAPGAADWRAQLDVPRGASSVVTWPPDLAQIAKASSPPPAPGAPPPTVREEKPWYISTRVLLAGSFTVLAAGATTGLGLWTLQAKSDFDAKNRQAPAAELQDLHDTAAQRGLMTNIGLGATALGLGLTTWFILADSGDEPVQSKVTVGGWAVPGGGGLVAGGKL